MFESLGDRIKGYEAPYNHKLTPRSCLVVRVDGKAFHTYTRGMEKPYDVNLRQAMIGAMDFAAKNMSGFKLAYHQSDEATFLLTDFDNHNTQGWFDYNLNKVVSITASAFTAAFNSIISYETGPHGHAMFDARAFIVPKEDVANVFVWRQQDWARNSLQMLAQAHFSHSQLQGKNQTDMHEMLHSINVNWALLDPSWKRNGTFLTRDGAWLTKELTYSDIDNLIFEGIS